MTSTSRILNRIVLVLGGLVLLAAAAAGLLVVVSTPLRDAARDALAAAVGAFGPEASVDLSGIGMSARAPIAALAAVGAGLVAIVLLLVFVCTRGKGRTRTVLRTGGGEGTTSVDVDVAAAVLADALADAPDVQSARVRAYRVRRAPALHLAITPRGGADLGHLLHDAHRAVARWDELSGERMPVLVHVTRRAPLRRPVRAR